MGENNKIINSEIMYDRTNVIVMYVPQSFDAEKFYELVSSVGPPESCKLIMKTVDGIRVNMGYGFARYANEELAARALEVLDGLFIHNKKIKVTYARILSGNEKDTNLYVSGVPRSLSEDEFLDIFTPYGTVICHRLLYHHLDMIFSRGVGFVRFNTKAEAQSAIAALNGTTLPGGDRQLHVRQARSRPLGYEVCARAPALVPPPVQMTYVLYVANFSNFWTEGVIYGLFNRCAPVEDVVVYRRDGLRCAFVTVWQYQYAIRLIQWMDGRYFGGLRLRVSFKRGASY